MRKVRFEYFQNNKNTDDPSFVLERRKIAAAKETSEKKKKTEEKKNKGSEKMKTEKEKNVQGRSPVPLMNFSPQHHLSSPSAAATASKMRATEEEEGKEEAMIPSLKFLSKNAAKTRNAKLEFFHGPGLLKNGTIGQSLKSLTANLKSEDFFPMNHSRTLSLSPKKLPPFPKSTDELFSSKNSRWPSPLQINGFKKMEETKILNFDVIGPERSKLKKDVDCKKLNFAKINNHSSAISCSDSLMERLDKAFLEDNKKVTTAASNLSGYRVIKGSKIINVERVVQHPHHQQQEAYEISAIDGMIWSKKV